jgi:hypothetical protein
MGEILKLSEIQLGAGKGANVGVEEKPAAKIALYTGLSTDEINRL